MEILNISVTYARENGERRRNNINYKKPLPIIVNKWNPMFTALNHNRHAGKIFRSSEGGFESKGKPRFYPDWFE